MIDGARRPPAALIFGMAGERLSEAETRFFAETDPLGFILFRRNCRDPDQVKALVTALRVAVGRAEAPILIDQEGGRVARLGPPHWPALPAPGPIGERARDDPAGARRAAEAHGARLAELLVPLGIDVDAVPLLDLRLDGASDVIGDRALSSDPEIVAELGVALGRGLAAGGVRPIIKHLPGHGRATVDSHVALPVVTADAALLEETDLVPFRRAAAADWPIRPWGMTAHVVYTAWDAERPATLSATVIEEVIRRRIGFAGLLLSDDLCMGALGQPVGERVALALAAGCDVALHCNGDLAEMRAAAAAARPLDDRALARLLA